MNNTYSTDNVGNRVPPHPNLSDPVLATGQELTNGTADTDTEATVVAGASYALTAVLTGGFALGLADASIDANKIWACALYQTIIIKIPNDYTGTLHYIADTTSSIGRLRRIAMPGD